MIYPLVTFVSPCYNHSKYIIESLESIRKQTYPNIYHIIVDDFSTDDSVIKIQKWIDENDYKCLFIQHKKNKGISYTLNESIDLAKGEFWTALATDDFIVPERTEVFVNHMLNHSEVNMITSDCGLVDENSEVIKLTKDSFFLNHYFERNEARILDQFGTYETLLEGNYIPSSLLIRRSVFKKIGKFDVNLRMEDWDMWLRISRISKIEFIPQNLTFYRYHSENSIKKIDTNNDFRLSILKQSKFNLPLKSNWKFWKYFQKEFPVNIKTYPNFIYLIKYTPPLILIRFMVKYLLLREKF